jgi:hypothetical protein
MSGVLAAMVGSSGAIGVIQTIPDVGSVSGDASIQLQNDGDIAMLIDGVTDSTTYDWVAPANTTVAAMWEVKVDATSGSFTSGTTGTWLALSSSRTWTKGTGTGEVVYTISFRSGGVVWKTQTNVSLSA